MKNNSFISICTAIIIVLVFLNPFNSTAQNQGDQKHQHSSFCAVTPSPYPFDLIQPNGEIFTGKVTGTPAAHYLETEDGFVVLQDTEGNYKYAIEGKNGALATSGFLVHSPEERTTAEIDFLETIQANYRYTGIALDKKLNDFKAQNNTQAKSITGYFPSSGTQEALLLLIDFPDKPFINTSAQFDDFCNQPGYSYNGHAGSFRDYYLDNSYGNLTINTDVAGWYTASQNHSYYGYSTDKASELVREAIDAAEAAGMDFSPYDNNGDGEVDAILVIHSGEGEETSGSGADIWSHQYWLEYNNDDVTYDGVNANLYIIQPERASDNMTSIGILAHEFGHALGLPDLYDGDNSSSGLGDWGIMAQGTWNNHGKTPSHMSAWCKQEMGWLSPTVLSGSGSISNMDYIENTGEVYRLNTPNPDEYYLISNRQKQGWDTYLEGEGLAIWHIDDAIQHPFNDNEWHPLVSLRQADGQYDLQNHNNNGDSGDLYPGSSGNYTFDGSSTPHSNNYDGSASGVYLTNISEFGLTTSFDYGAPAYPSTIVRGPYLQSGTSSSTIIKWRTSNSTQSKVWYGDSPTNLNQTETINSNQTDHEVTILGLSPNTTYYYAIGDDGGQMQGANSNHYFKTAPVVGSSQPITAWILGDCGAAPLGSNYKEDQEAVRDAYYNYIGTDHTDMVLLLGDNAYNDGTDSEYQEAIFDMYPAKLKNSMLWSCPGNHDYYSGNGTAVPYYDIFSFPTQGQGGGLASNTEKYYSYDYGNLHIISLDSQDEDRHSGSPMLTWLENDLASTAQEWIVVIFHHPPYTKSGHDSDSEIGLVEMRQYVIPICEDYGVDLVLSGHNHTYERSKLINGHYGLMNTYDPSIHNIDGGDGQLDGDGAYQKNGDEEGTVYIVTGSAGKKSGVGVHDVMHYAVSQLGSTILEVNGGQMDIKFLNDDGVIEDHLTLIQSGTPIVSWTNPLDNEVFTNLSTITLTADASDNDGSITQVDFFVNGLSVGTDFSAPYSMNWTPSAYANYVLKVEATDNEGKTNAKEIDIIVQDGASFAITVQINNDDDDAEERVSNGDINLSSSDLELVDESGSTSQEVGMRFNNVNIPTGATITNSYIQFTADGTDAYATNLNIYGQDHDNPSTFLDINFDISTRSKTSASVNWNPVAWTAANAAGTVQQTPNLNNLIQEIINRPGWTPNNSMAFLITGSGERTAYSYDGSSSKAPTLHILYTLESNNCDPFTDNDNDGYCSDVDCDDLDATVYPGAPEICDGIDNNCNQQIDEGVLGTYYADTDGDGFGDINNFAQGCLPPAGYVTNDTDCDDTNAAIHPNATEICDGIDNDCDQQIDEGPFVTYYADTDGDGFGDINNFVQDCFPPAGYVTNATDCDDTNAAIHPNATEICDGIDNNCDQQIDEGLLNTYYADTDGDGFGDINNFVQDCLPPSGYVTNDDDCNDSNPAIHPNATEICDGIDNDCNQQTDEGLLGTYYADTDGDGFGDINNFVQDCFPLAGYVTNDADCDDSNAAIHPNATEICDGIDNDCDQQIDEGLLSTYYADTDGDGFGDINNFIQDCLAPSGYVSDATDCDDSNAAIHPNATEICDGIDNNCDQQIDENACGGTYCTPIHTGTENELITNVTIGSINNTSGGWNTNITGYSDYTNLSSQLDNGSSHSITVSSNYSWTDSQLGIWIDWNQNFIFDSNEEITSQSGEGPWTVSFVPPAGATLGTTRMRIRLQYGASYTPDPCAGSTYYSGETEDYSLELINCTVNTYYADSDGDNYGNANVSVLACSAPSGYVTDNTDCDDTNSAIYPTATCNDGDPLSNNDQYDLNCNCVGTNNPNNTIISVAISSGNDDVEEIQGNGYVNTNSDDLEIVTDGSNNQKVGLRFNDINIPQGATIHYAYIQFTADENDSGTTNLNIEGQLTDNAPTFQNTYYDVSDRATSNAFVSWTPAAWTSGDTGTEQQSPNLNTIVQEIINQNNWTANNSVAFIISGNGNREAESYEGLASGAAKLYIEYDPSCAVDVDNDGLCANLDCDDNDASNTGLDADGDNICTPIDCNDSDAAIYPGAICDDGDPDTIEDEYNSNCICEGIPNPIITIETSISSGSDDVEEKESNGDVYSASTDLELVYDSWNSQNNQTVGMRFNGLDIPTGAIVTAAYIQFTADASNTNAANLTIYGHDHDNAPAFQDVNYDVSGRTKTSASINWTPPSWSSGDVGLDQQTPDLKNIAQEIINRSGWNTGNSMVFTVSGIGVREADSYEGGSSKAPKLHVEYMTALQSVPENGSPNTSLAHGGELSNSNLSLYPNPVEDELTLAYRSMDESETFVELFNSTGVKVLFRPIKVLKGLNVIQLNVSQLPEGIYFLNINETNRRLTKQVVILR